MYKYLMIHKSHLYQTRKKNRIDKKKLFHHYDNPILLIFIRPL